MTENENPQPETQQNTNEGKIGVFIWELTKVVIIAAMLIIPTRLLLAQPFSVKGDSMEESFSNYDYLIVDQISYRFQDIARGDVVVFHPPLVSSKDYYIKRVIGLPGDIVRIKNGEVEICEKGDEDHCYILNESEYLSAYERTPGNEEFVVSPDSYVVLGDNRNASSDSRSWGELPRENIVGKVVLRAWPFDVFGVIKHPSYSIN